MKSLTLIQYSMAGLLKEIPCGPADVYVTAYLKDTLLYRLGRILALTSKKGLKYSVKLSNGYGEK